MDNKGGDLKVCGVCGDKALGYNFNAVTCESCKAFFRRNALTKKDFRCPFNHQCDITTVTRRFCQKCRLEKCFTIGMRKDYIMSEKDKVLKRQKIEENKAKRHSHPSNGFKQGFKKMKREPSIDDDSQEYDTSDYGELYSPAEQTSNSTNTKDQCNLGNVINYSNSNIEINSNRIENDDEHLHTSDVSNNSDVEESMIRTMLNPTPNGSIINSDGPESPLFTNNNDTNCNNNSGKNITNNDAKHTAKVVLEEVRR